MNDEERQKILDIFNKDVTLKAPMNQEKQERIEQLIKEIYSKGVNEDDNTKRSN